MISKYAKRTLLPAVLAGALAAIGWVGTARLAEHRIARMTAAAGAHAGRIGVDLFSGRVVLDDVVADYGGGHLRIGEMALQGGLALVTPALAADSFTLTDVTYDFQVGSTKSRFRYPLIEVSGASVGRQELLGLIGPNAADNLSKKIAAVSATSIMAPEVLLELTLDGGGLIATGIYRAVALRDIRAGIVGEMTIAGMTFIANEKTPSMRGSFGALRLAEFDAVLATRFFNEAARPDEQTLKLLYSSFSVDNVAMTGGDGVRLSLDRLASGPFKLRLGDRPWLEVYGTLSAVKDIEDAPLADRARFSKAILDVYSSFELSTLELDGLRFDGSQLGKPGQMSISRIALAGADKGEARIEGTEVIVPDVQFKLGLATIGGFSFKPTVQAAAEWLAKPDMKAAKVEPRKFTPLLRSVLFADMALDAPSGQAAGERLKMSMSKAEFNCSRLVNGLAIDGRTVIEHFVLVVPPGSQTEGFKDLLDVGYQTLDTSMISDITWDEAGSEYVIKEFSLSTVDAGSVTLRATFGNITTDTFSSDSAVAAVAALGTTVKALAVEVQNRGGFERGLKLAATRQGRSPDDLRQEVGQTAAIALPAMLGDSAGAKAIAAAVTKFIVKPGTLSIGASAKSRAGLGLADFVAVQANPRAIFDKIDITASAQ